MAELDYIGGELELFAQATNWKSYVRARLAPHVRGRVLEVGAGIGATTRALAGIAGVAAWTCLEPDPQMAATLADAVAALPGGVPTKVVTGTLDDLPADDLFDTILYIDVLEHIEDDRREVERAARRLRPGGRLVILCPAFQSLFTPFDAAIGHFRRYTRGSLSAVGCAGLIRTQAFYMDSIGLLASLANKLALRQSAPTAGQVALWDKAMVPVSRLLDPVLRWFGKSIVVIWTREPATR